MPDAKSQANVKALARLKRDGIGFVRCQFVDLIGIARNRLVPTSQMGKALQRGLAFGAFGTTLDIDDIPSDPEIGSHSGDMWAVPDPDSFAPVPWLNSTGHMFCDLVAVDGSPWPSCPRSALTSLTPLFAREIGAPEFAYEAEGYLLVRTETGRYEPAYRGHGWNAEMLDAQQPFIDEFTAALAAMQIPVERLQVEGGYSQFEAALRHDTPVRAVQDHFRFKQAFRAIARRHGLVGSFMPKPLPDRDGSGLHVHISARRGAKDALFTGGDLSPAGRHFVGGLIAHAGALVAIGCPSINSYKRMQPGFFAPTHAIWGRDNRSALVRVVSSGRHGQRVEFRAADGTCNPFLLGAALLAAGLDGVRRKLDPGEAVSEDVARWTAVDLAKRGIVRTPWSLDRALDALEDDEALAQVLGQDLVQAFLYVKRSENAKYSAYVSDWEYRYYAEQH
jgi:glutamine synthetase